MPSVTRSRLCSRVSAWAGAFAKCSMAKTNIHLLIIYICILNCISCLGSSSGYLGSLVWFGFFV